MHKGPYVIQPGRAVGRFDVVRSEPTVVAADLKHGEAQALAAALNNDIRLLEGNQ